MKNFAGQWLLPAQRCPRRSRAEYQFPRFRREPPAVVHRGKPSSSSRAIVREDRSRCSTWSTPTTRSSTSASPATTASRRCTAAISGASRSTDGRARRAARTRAASCWSPPTPTATSPVLRGKWILENLLGTPPPPPPPDVPALKAKNRGRARALDARADGAASRQSGVRELPRLDGSARLRARDRSMRWAAWRTADENDNPIDASGAFPDGTHVRRRRSSCARRSRPAPTS